MPDPRWLRHLVLPDLRERVFDPALAAAQRERAVRRRQARGAVSRTAIEILFFWRAASAVARCQLRPRPRRPLMLRHDLTFAFRMLRKAPGFTVAAVLAIALGIGANTAIFTVIKQVLLQPLPYPDPARIVDVNEYRQGAPFAVSPPNFADWRRDNQTLSALSLYGEQILTLTGAGTEPARISAAMIDASLGDVIGVAPMLGRSFTDADMRPGGRKVVILGYALWQSALGGDRGVIARQIELEGEPYEVVGVMPRGYGFPDDSEAWLPLRLTPAALQDRQRGAHYLSAIGRLKPAVTAAQSSADLDRIERGIAARFPTQLSGYTVAAVPLLTSMVGPVQRPLLILFAAVAFVLLIACVNVANLLLARATTRTGEIAVRAALGAARGQLVRQLLAESIVLAVAGGAAGLLLASWGVRALMRMAPPDLPRAADVRIDITILVFSALLSILAGLLFGTVPACLASRPDLGIFLRDAGRDAGASGSRRRLRAALVTIEVALALLLLAGAGLAIRSFQRLTHVDPGFRAANVLTFNISLPEASFPSAASQFEFFRDYTERLRQIPGVAAAGAVNLAPVSHDGFGGSFTIPGRAAGEDEGNAQIRSVTPGYFETLSIPLLAGRGVTGLDTSSGVPVAIVSESAARRFWPGENPIGKQLRLHVNEPQRLVREIVGVAGDVRTRGMAAEPVPVVYIPHTQYGPESMTMVLRGVTDPASLLPQVKSALREQAPGVAMGRVRTMNALIAADVAQPRFRTRLLTLFAGVSLLLAAVGLYGVVAFSVSQRRTELGLRMALGANPREVLRLVIREGMRPVVVGLVLGLGGAGILGRVMTSLLYGTDAFDPLTFGVVAATLACVGLVACYIPARRATRLDPASTLR